MPESSAELAPATLFDLKGRVAVITGGGTGIGLMQGRALHAAGCKVYIIGRRGEVLDNAVRTYGFAGKFEGDMTSKEDIERVAREAESAEGKVDILIANAGGSGPTHHGADTSFPTHENDPAPGGKLQRMSPQEYKNEIWKKNDFSNWDDLFHINTHHILFVAIAFLPLMARASELGLQNKQRPYTATFVSTGSISGLVKQAQMHYAYNAAKAAANHLTELLAFEFTQTTTAKIRVNCLAPGVFPSDMTAGGHNDKNVSDLSDKLPTMSIPAGRPGTTTDMVSVHERRADNIVTLLICSRSLPLPLLAVGPNYPILGGLRVRPRPDRPVRRRLYADRAVKSSSSVAMKKKFKRV